MTLWTFRSWPDRADAGRWIEARGWWLRLGTGGPGMDYRNLSRAGHQPLFSERYGRDRALALRVGPHLWRLLPPRRGLARAMRRHPAGSLKIP